ncbi:hypothetical protein [Streptomyces sp. NPDC023327]|uniref:hypothetical protein n=1 Tax=Streptomyces sp. NPDC023327 TaxID=3157088 RepID=UPI0033ECDFEB
MSGCDHADPHPGPLPHQMYAALIGGPLDGLLLDITLAAGTYPRPSSGGEVGREGRFFGLLVSGSGWRLVQAVVRLS